MRLRNLVVIRYVFLKNLVIYFFSSGIIRDVRRNIFKVVKKMDNCERRERIFYLWFDKI